MLYIEPNEYGEIEEFIFDAKPYNEDINLSDVAALEGFFKKEGYIPKKYIDLLLNYVIYQARIKVVRPPDSPINSSFKAKCSPAASIIKELMGKMGFKVDTFNVGDIVNTDNIHRVSIVHVPTIVDGKKEVRDYLMDPTFRQFTIKEENRFERYFEEARGNVRMATPHPGYFFGLTKERVRFANDLIKYGYFLATDDNLKKYFDPFKLYVTPKEEYDSNSLGMISSTNFSGNYYRNKISKSIEVRNDKSYHDILTPMEKIIDKKRKMSYRIKNLFGLADLYESNIEIEKEFTK